MRTWVSRSPGDRAVGWLVQASRQRGQSLVLASILLMVVTLVLLLMFNTAQLTSSRMQLQNTADSTAYSVATIAARDYNFAAYMNRAMVANQAAAAQMVGLASWFRYTGQTLDNLAVICAPVPGLDAICLAMAETYTDFRLVWEESVLPILMQVINYWMISLSELQRAFHYGNVEAIVQNLGYNGGIAQAGILQQNDPDARLLAWPDSRGDIPAELYKLAILTRDAGDWWHYTSRYDNPAAEMGRFAEVASGSVDGFSKSRSWYLGGKVFDTDWVMKHIPSWLRDIIDDLFLVQISASMDLGLSRKGGTELKRVNDKYTWSAADTLMGDGEAKINVRFACGVKICHWHGVPYPCGWNWCTQSYTQHVDIPFGWGAAYTGPSGDSTPGEAIFHSGLDGKQYGGAAAGMARPTFELGVGEYGDTPVASFDGLQPYYDISKPDAVASRTNDGPQLTIVISKAMDKIRTASRVGIGAPAGSPGSIGLGALRLEEPGTENLYAIAKGKLHFGMEGQYSNLFSPYWEAKLGDTTDSERKQAYIALFQWQDWIPPLGATPKANGLNVYVP